MTGRFRPLGGSVFGAFLGLLRARAAAFPCLEAFALGPRFPALPGLPQACLLALQPSSVAAPRLFGTGSRQACPLALQPSSVAVQGFFKRIQTGRFRPLDGSAFGAFLGLLRAPRRCVCVFWSEVAMVDCVCASFRNPRCAAPRHLPYTIPAAGACDRRVCYASIGHDRMLLRRKQWHRTSGKRADVFARQQRRRGLEIVSRTRSGGLPGRSLLSYAHFACTRGARKCRASPWATRCTLRFEGLLHCSATSLAGPVPRQSLCHTFLRRFRSTSSLVRLKVARLSSKLLEKQRAASPSFKKALRKIRSAAAPSWLRMTIVIVAQNDHRHRSQGPERRTVENVVVGGEPLDQGIISAP